MNQNTDEVDDLLDDIENNRRTNTEATDTDTTRPLPELIADELDAIDAGDTHATISYRDARMSALLDALLASDDLTTVVDQAAAELDKDSPDDPGRSDACRLLMRVGLQAIAVEQYDAAAEGVRRHQQRKSENAEF